MSLIVALINYFRTSVNLETHGCTIGRYRSLISLPYPRNEETPSNTSTSSVSQCDRISTIIKGPRVDIMFVCSYKE